MVEDVQKIAKDPVSGAERRLSKRWKYVGRAPSGPVKPMNPTVI